MTLSEYCNAIDFDFIYPDTPGIALTTMDRGVGKTILDMLNTILPREEVSGRVSMRLQPLLRMPRMSTFAIAAIINRCVQDMADGTAFVNVGVWHGFTFLSGCVGNAQKRCIGIDNFSEFGGPRAQFLDRFKQLSGPFHEFHETDYRNYFKSGQVPEIGFYIYDGDHSRQNQCDGLLVAEPHFADGAVILVDDFNFNDVVAGTNDFLAKAKHKYRPIFSSTTADNMHPTWWNGVAIFQRI